jgi:hypothetical protein
LIISPLVIIVRRKVLVPFVPLATRIVALATEASATVLKLTPLVDTALLRFDCIIDVIDGFCLIPFE